MQPKVSNKLLNVFWPGKCCACLFFLDFMGICELCRHQLTPRRGHKCTVCDLAFKAAGPQHICGRCLDRRPKFDDCRGIFDDSGPAGHMVRNGKYTRWPEAIDVLADEVVRHLPGEFTTDLPKLIIPIPLHRKRLYSRGFSAPAILARSIGRTMGIPVNLKSLTRMRDTVSQTGLNLKERRSNVRGAFSVKDLASRDILLVDDVFTTGATVDEAARVLKQAGAERVRVVCASYVDENREKIPSGF